MPFPVMKDITISFITFIIYYLYLISLYYILLWNSVLLIKIRFLTNFVINDKPKVFITIIKW